MNFQVEKPKVDLYRVRTFGQKFSATFDFIKENYKLLLKACFYLILPVCLFQAFAFERLMTAVASDNMSSVADDGSTSGALSYLLINTGLSYILLLICICLGTLLLFSICFAMIRYYNESPTRLQGVTLRDLKPLIIQCMKRSFLMGLVFSVAWVVIVVILALFAFIFFEVASNDQFPNVLIGIGLFFLVIIGLLVAFVPATVSWPVYLFEDDETVFSAIRRGWRLGIYSFFPLIGLMFIMALIENVLQTVTTLPWYFMYLAKVFLTAANAEEVSIASSPVYNFVEYILSVVMNFGTYLATILTIIALAFHYGSVAEEVDGVSVEESIQNFDQLAEKDNDIDDFDKL
ncbi:MAG: hypothetical protein HXO51_02850 [Prevotella sp.]|nr:hypothetical protein [Prevotella sp.]